jgi:thiol:disulfide interchange protein DsbD
MPGKIPWCLLALGLSLAAGAAAGAQTQARLLLANETARPGTAVLAGVQVRLAPRWHTYWRNPGDSGAPTKIEWNLPPGVQAGAVLWPVPEKLKSEDLTTYVYHQEVVLLVPLTLASNLPPGALTLRAKLSWLECDKLCLPGKADLQAQLTIGDQAKPSPDAPVLAAWEKRLPRPQPPPGASAWWEKPAVADARPVVLAWKPAAASAKADFYPFEGEGFEVSAETEALPLEAGKMRLRKVVKKLEGAWPNQISGLILEQAGAEPPAAYTVTLPISAKPPAGPAAAAAPAASLPAMLGLAFLGGLILNLMPCVLPVIALKILGFVRQSQAAPGRVKQLGLIYGLGVVSSFLGLAGLVILVQQAGHAASWGMQFQHPQFVVVMATLVTLVALNLFGVFEVSLGGRALGAAAELSGQEGGAGAFFHGVLTTVLATPCTAPVLAVALGFAFAQPAGTILLMFLVMGLGLAAPYVLLSWFPQWLKLLPKPGAWMAQFKLAMGFPMLATGVWLLSLTTPFYGAGGPLWVGLFLVAVGFAAWLWGAFAQRGRGILAAALGLGLAGLAYGYGLEKELHWRSPAPAAMAGAPTASSGGIAWQPWSPGALEQARSQGHPVLVDFTADWCVTCQVNKKSSLEAPSVSRKLREDGVVALLGDYTRENPEITRELRRFGRAGVPLVLVYPRDAQKPPLVLPSLLTPGIVLDALKKAR